MISGPTTDNRQPTTNQVLTGDCLEWLRTLPAQSVDAVITDPPYGIGFMSGKIQWDGEVPPALIWRECHRVLKAGCWLMAMSSPRQDVLAAMITNIQEAGFNVGFTSIYWAYASGLPKAANLGKKSGRPNLQGAYAGFQPKPAIEVVLVAMKPLSQNGYLAQAEKDGKGVTYLDAGRIPYKPGDRPQGGYGGMGIGIGKPQEHQEYTGCNESDPRGRFASNLLVSDDVLNDGQVSRAGGDVSGREPSHTGETGVYGNYNRVPFKGHGDRGSFSRYFSLDAWWETALKKLPPSIRATVPFLPVSKPPKNEKGAHIVHPTVKPVALMSYLVTIATSPDGLVLDPFCGSGTTCVAAALCGRRYLGMDISEEYCTIARQRLALEAGGLFA